MVSLGHNELIHCTCKQLVYQTLHWSMKSYSIKMGQCWYVLTSLHQSSWWYADDLVPGNDMAISNHLGDECPHQTYSVIDIILLQPLKKLCMTEFRRLTDDCFLHYRQSHHHTEITFKALWLISLLWWQVCVSLFTCSRADSRFASLESALCSVHWWFSFLDQNEK